MQFVEIPKTGWKKLDWITARFAEMISQRTIIPGVGIDITEKPTGVIVGLKVAGEDQKGGPSDAGWHQLTVINSTDCSQEYIWYWGTGPTKNKDSPPPKTKPISA